MKRLPASFRELLLVVLGAYGMVAGFALLCNWNGQERLAVVIVLLIGLVGVLMLEGLAVAAILTLASTQRRSTPAAKQLKKK